MQILTMLRVVAASLSAAMAMPSTPGPCMSHAAAATMASQVDVPHPSTLAADHLRLMLQGAHDARDGARLMARKLSVESALLPAFIVQELAHGCAANDLAASLAFTYRGPLPSAERSARSGPTMVEPGWGCPPGMAWRVRATTERLCSAGPEPAVAIDWLIETDGLATTAIAERFEPAIMPAELDFPLLPWNLELRWDQWIGRAIDHSGRSHAERWVDAQPILANPDDMVDTFDAIRVHQWLARLGHGLEPSWQPSGATPNAWWAPDCPGPVQRSMCRSPQPSFTHVISLDRGPCRWHDPNAYTLTNHGPSSDRAERFRPVRLIPSIAGLRAIIEWRCWTPDAAGLDDQHAANRPTRMPSRIVLIDRERTHAIITFGRFALVRRGELERTPADPPWIAVRDALEHRDATTLAGLVLRSQDGLGTVQARARMGVELALQAFDAAVDAGWTMNLLRSIAPELLDRCLDRLTPTELVSLTLDATAASRGSVAILCATRLAVHPAATADERAWASLALPSLWAWLQNPPADDSPMGARRLACDRALRPILLGEPQPVSARTNP